MQPSLQRGYSLSELLLCAAVVVVGMAGVFGVYKHVARGNALDETIKETQALVSRIEEGIGRTKSYHGLDTAQAVALGLVPAGFLQDGEPRTRWGALDISAAGAQHDRIRVVYQDVPADNCIDLVAALAPLAETLRVNDAVVGERFRVDVGATGAACENGGVVELEHFQSGLGMKAQWETW